MKEDNAAVKSEVGPNLLVPPHVLPALMELFAGEKKRILSQQEQLLAHLATCHYCRTAVMVMLSQELEYDRRNNDIEEPTRDLLTRFANIDREIDAQDAHQYERLGAYAEAIVNEGRDKAGLRFPDIVAHLSACSDCRAALEATVAFISEPEEAD